MDYTQLVREVFQHLAQTKRADWYTKMFNYALQGYSSKEMAEKEGVSQTIVSRYIKGLEDELKSYAQKTDNDLLLRLIQNKTTRRHTFRQADELQDIGDALRQYKKQVEARTASVEFARSISRSRSHDILSDDVMGDFIQSQFVGDTEIHGRVDDFVSMIQNAGDVIERDDGDLTFLTEKARRINQGATDSVLKQVIQESARLSLKHDIPLPGMLAIAEVESAGQVGVNITFTDYQGIRRSGLFPLIRIEGHYFYNRLAGKTSGWTINRTKLDKAVKAGLGQAPMPVQ